MPFWPFRTGTKDATAGNKSFDSARYWKGRYESGRNSGAGSYGRLAKYKADFINELVTDNEISSVVEFGSGDGNQASLFKFANYLGVDVASLVVENCRDRFEDRTTWEFKTIDQYDEAPERRDMSMSLDVIYHLIEDDVFEAYMQRLFSAAERFVLVYSSDHHEIVAARHVRHRHYSKWVDQNLARWRLKRSFDNPYSIDLDGDAENSSFAYFSLFERLE